MLFAFYMQEYLLKQFTNSVSIQFITMWITKRVACAKWQFSYRLVLWLSVCFWQQFVWIVDSWFTMLQSLKALAEQIYVRDIWELKQNQIIFLASLSCLQYVVNSASFYLQWFQKIKSLWHSCSFCVSFVQNITWKSNLRHFWKKVFQEEVHVCVCSTLMGFAHAVAFITWYAWKKLDFSKGTCVVCCEGGLIYSKHIFKTLPPIKNNP